MDNLSDYVCHLGVKYGAGASSQVCDGEWLGWVCLCCFCAMLALSAPPPLEPTFLPTHAHTHTHTHPLNPDIQEHLPKRKVSVATSKAAAGVNPEHAREVW